MMSNGLSTRRVKWVSDAMLCQVKLFMLEDCPAQVGTNNEDHLQSKRSSQPNGVSFDDLPPGFGGNGYSDTLNQTRIPQIKWKRPPMFVLNSGWHVVAGEQSEESGAQSYREMRVLEAVYPRASAIPPSPLFTPELEHYNYDDMKTPIIPVIPIEEEDLTQNESPPCTISAAMGQHGMAATSPQYNVPFDSKAMVVQKSNGASTFIEADVAAAASAAFTAILQSNQEESMVDPELLIKLLRDPKLIETHFKNSAPATNMATPVSEQKQVTTSIPLSSSHLSVSKVLVNETSTMHNVQEKPRPASDSWLTCQPFHDSSISRLSATSCDIPSLDRTLANSHQMVKYSQPPSTTSARMSETPHAISSRLAEVDRVLKSIIPPPVALSSSGSKFASLPVLSASFQGTVNSGKPVVDRLELPARELPTSSSRPLVSNAASSCLFNHIDSTQPSLRSTDTFSPKAGDLVMSHRSDMASPTIPPNLSLPAETHLFRSSLQSPSPPPDRFQTPFPSVRTPVLKDTSYYMNLIRQHGMERNNESPENTPQYQSGPPELTAVSGQVHGRPKSQKACKYFNSQRGCRNGLDCPFEHNTLVNLLDSERSKRFKFSRDS